MFEMHPDKAPGPDGFNPGFYQKMWPEIGAYVIRACRTWLREGEIPEMVQATTIVLLPKVAQPQNMTELRLISLCNVLYRLVAKVLANRLRRLFPHIIGPEQSAFIEVGAYLIMILSLLNPCIT
ncbi:LINE-1 retrotransposable element ORF2 protein [Linum grandiflorum]